jgi:hypothetical protein
MWVMGYNPVIEPVQNLLIQEKLLALKSQSGSSGRVVLASKVGKKVKSYFFPIVTSALLIAFIVTNLLQKMEVVSQNIDQKKSDWITKIVKLVDLNDDLQSQTWNQLENELNQSVLPLSNFVGGSSLVESDIKKIVSTAKLWQKNIEPLTKYKVNSQGIVYKGVGEKYFTDDLNNFFTRSESLLPESEKVWSDMWYYRLVLGVKPNSNLSLALQSIRQLLDTLPEIIANKTQILTALGHFTTQRIVIFNQNVGEARPTGGFIGSYLPVDIFKGTIKLGQSNSIYYVDNSKPKPLITHPANWYYDYRTGVAREHGIRNLNYFSCFPDTAQALEREFALSPNGYGIDTLIMITPQVLKNFFPDDLSLNVPGVGVLNSANLIDEVERITSIQAVDMSNPKSQLTPIVDALLAKLPQIVDSGKLDITQSVLNSFDSRDLQIWFKNTNIQHLWSELGLAAEQTCQAKTNTHIITPLIANISADKRNLVTKNEFSLNAQRVMGGYKLEFNFKEYLPENPQLQRQFNKNDGFTFVGLQIPAEAFDIKVESAEALNLPFKRDYYKQILPDFQNGDPKTPPEIEQILRTSSELKNQGFTYIQPDKSMVAGIYVEDETVTNVRFSFTLPVESEDEIEFYSQPGLNQPSLNFGDGAVFKESLLIKTISDRQKLQSGVEIILR